MMRWKDISLGMLTLSYMWNCGTILEEAVPVCQDDVMGLA